MPRKKVYQDRPPRKPTRYRAADPDAKYIRSYNSKHELGYSFSTALRNVERGLLPPRVEISPGIKAWVRDDVEKYRAKLQQTAAA